MKRQRHPFGQKIDEFLVRKPGLRQADLARGIGQPASVVSRMCYGQSLSGGQSRERIVKMIRWFVVDEGIAISLDEANAFLTSADHSELREGHQKEDWLLDNLPGPHAETASLIPLYSTKEAFPQAPPPEQIAQQLDEWKIVHTHAQELLFATWILEDQFRELSKQGTPVSAQRLADQWSQWCTSKPS